MFTPQDLEKIPKELEKLFSQLEMDIMLDIIRRMKANNNEITRTADYQIKRLYDLGVSKISIKKYIQTALELSRKEINKIYKEAIKSGYAEDKKLYKWLGKKQIAYEDNESLQQLISAIKGQTNNDLYNITQSTGFIKNVNGQNVFTPLTEYYQDTLDNAVNGVLNGAFDYNTVIKKTVQEMTKSGLRTVDYASGRSYRIDIAARMCVMTGVNQVTSKISEMNMEELHTDYAEVSAHGTARPSHQKWQGRVWSKQELVEVCGLGKADGLCGINCRHHFWAFIPGVSVRNYTDEQLEQWAKEENTPKKYGDKEYTAYEASQEQRRLERVLRKQRQDIKLLKEGEANEGDITIAQARYRITSDEYVKFSKAMGLPEQRARVYQDGLTGNYVGSKEVNELKNIKNDGILKADNKEISNYEEAKVTKLEKLEDLSDENKVATLEKYEKEIMNKDVENAIIIEKNGQVYLVESKEQSSVNIKSIGEEKLKGAYVTHNHPQQVTHYSFSAFDISEFMETGIQKFRGVDNKYIYEIEKLAETIFVNRDKVFYEFGSTIRNKIFDEHIWPQKLDADLVEYDLIVKEMAKMYNFRYRRWENDEN